MNSLRSHATVRAGTPLRDALDGVLLLDKPRGLTSNHALQSAKRLLQARKAGHTGTLDPMATGLLPLCFGEATKFAGMLLNADKTYEAVVQLGVATTTGDADGQIVSRRQVDSLEGRLDAVMQELKELREQTPPMYSALKHRGRPLYEYARAGEVVQRAVRQISIASLEWERRPSDTLWVRTRVSKGTYVRALAEEIGLRLGCGAHLAALRRTSIGSMQIAQAVGFDELEALELAQRRGRLFPVDFLTRELPAIEVVEADRLLQGQAVSVAQEARLGPVRIYDTGGRFLGVGDIAPGGKVAPRRLLAAGAQTGDEPCSLG